MDKSGGLGRGASTMNRTLRPDRPIPRLLEDSPVRLHHRLTAALATVSLALGAGVAVAGSATAAPDSTPAATASFSSVKISGVKKKYTIPKSGTKEYTFKVSITGTAAGDDVEYKPQDADFDGAEIVNLKTKVKSPYRIYVYQPSRLKTGSNTYSFRLPSYASPGKYELRVPVTQNDWSTSPKTSVTKVAKVRFEVWANKSATAAATRYYLTPFQKGKTAKFEFKAPEYEKGAKVTLYYKPKKAKKYKKLVTKTLKVKNGSAQAILKTKKIWVGDKFYFKVGATSWAKSYKTRVDKIVSR